MKELATALAKAQAAMKPAKRSVENSFFKTSYADLADVWAACQEPLTSNGLSVSQTTDFDENGIWIRTVLMHTSGESLEGRFPVRPLKPDPQALGSATSYARRYALAAMVGVVTEDDDGNEGSKKIEAASNGHHVDDRPANSTQSRKMESEAVRKAREWTNGQLSVLLKMTKQDSLDIWLDRWGKDVERLKDVVPDEYDAMKKAIARAETRLNPLAAG